jgi:hypothetical protein
MINDQDTAEICLVRSNRNPELSIRISETSLHIRIRVINVCALRQFPLHSSHRIHKVNERLGTFLL